jgi:hypothetical protein
VLLLQPESFSLVLFSWMFLYNLSPKNRVVVLGTV